MFLMFALLTVVLMRAGGTKLLGEVIVAVSTLRREAFPCLVSVEAETEKAARKESAVGSRGVVRFEAAKKTSLARRGRRGGTVGHATVGQEASGNAKRKRISVFVLDAVGKKSTSCFELPLLEDHSGDTVAGTCSCVCLHVAHIRQAANPRMARRLCAQKHSQHECERGCNARPFKASLQGGSRQDGFGRQGSRTPRNTLMSKQTSQDLGAGHQVAFPEHQLRLTESWPLTWSSC